jgi:hypothetical protein
MEEKDVSEVVFDEFYVHAHDVDEVHSLHVESDLVALLEAVHHGA